jgi:hypothetical protein
MKNRKREICTSGTVRDEDGNILIYSANAKVRKPALDLSAGRLGAFGEELSLDPQRFRQRLRALVIKGTGGLQATVLISLS